MPRETKAHLRQQNQSLKGEVECLQRQASYNIQRAENAERLVREAKAQKDHYKRKLLVLAIQLTSVSDLLRALRVVADDEHEDAAPLIFHGNSPEDKSGIRDWREIAPGHRVR